MRNDLMKLCNNGYRVHSRYKHWRETLAARGNGNESSFGEMLYRISNGKYGQGSERELIATRYNIIIRVYDAYANRWIVNRDVDPNGDRVIAILWDRISTHYDLLNSEGDGFDLNRSRQLQHISSRCSLQSQNSTRRSQVLTGMSQF